MSHLLQIQPMVQQVAEAISAALKVETEIVDETLTVVAGTGKYRKRVNTKEEGGVKEAGFLYGKVLLTNEAYVVEDARRDPTYDPSVLTGEVDEVAEICCPIEYNRRTIGVIGLVAFNQEQHRYLVENKEQMLLFLRRMAELLASKVSEKEAMRQLQVTTNKMQTLIESIHEGILAIDEEGVITHCNRTTEILVKQSRRNLIGKHLQTVWPGSPMLKVLETGKGYVEKEEIYSHASHSMHFVVTATPIRIEEKISGVVATVRRMSDVRKLAYSLTNHQKVFSFSEIIGTSKSIQLLKEQAMRVAPSNSNILITGESGTGKGIFAMAIHYSSPRRSGPFVTVNCGAIPESLLESELFGYAKGAFTGANREGKVGKFELADGGTIFLDEIGDLPLHLQVKLLHVLQYKEVERIGSGRLIPVDVRVIAATNRNLEDMVAEGEFRSDLYFRLNVIPLSIPPLRERKEDIPLLMNHFLQKYTNTLRKEISGYEEEVVRLFMDYPWPGNVRELENAVEYAVNFENGTLIRKESVPPRILRNVPVRKEPLSLKERLHRHEGDILREMMEKYGESFAAKKRIARELKVSMATLYRKLEEHRLSEPIAEK
ncbi:sigma 54-interacting transcriptional regulator [Bacillaceae bacterium]